MKQSISKIAIYRQKLMNSEIAHINMNFSILPTLSYSRAQETNHMSSSLLICIKIKFS